MCITDARMGINFAEKEIYNLVDQGKLDMEMFQREKLIIK